MLIISAFMAMKNGVRRIVRMNMYSAYLQSTFFYGLFHPLERKSAFAAFPIVLTVVVMSFPKVWYFEPNGNPWQKRNFSY
jgi:hypothetical protein